MRQEVRHRSRLFLRRIPSNRENFPGAFLGRFFSAADATFGQDAEQRRATVPLPVLLALFGRSGQTDFRPTEESPFFAFEVLEVQDSQKKNWIGQWCREVDQTKKRKPRTMS